MVATTSPHSYFSMVECCRNNLQTCSSCRILLWAHTLQEIKTGLRKLTTVTQGHLMRENQEVYYSVTTKWPIFDYLINRYASTPLKDSEFPSLVSSLASTELTKGGRGRSHLWAGNSNLLINTNFSWDIQQLKYLYGKMRQGESPEGCTKQQNKR